MIRYSLKCPDGHAFESWFQSADAFDSLKAAGHVSCAQCGSTSVEKAMMAPQVQSARGETARETREGPRANKAPGEGTPAPQDPRHAALAELRRRVEANSEYVGMRFATEARRMHEGAAPERAIYGEARFDEAKALIEDGVPVAPLPFVPTRRAN